MDTAEIAFGNAFPIITDSRLRECNYGDLTQTSKDIVDAEKLKRIHAPFPGGESYEQCAKRMKSFLQVLLVSYDGKKVMIIGHRATQYGLEHWTTSIPLETTVEAPWKWQPGWKNQLIKLAWPSKLRLGLVCQISTRASILVRYNGDMAERYRIIPAVFVVVHEEVEGTQHVLLQRRAGTGYRDGWYDAPSGHYEEVDGLPQIAAARELEEETGLVAQPGDLELFHIVTNEHESPGKPYWYVVFRVPLAQCTGSFAIQEPEKSDDMGMFPIDALPDNLVPHVRQALEHLEATSVTCSRISDTNLAA